MRKINKYITAITCLILTVSCESDLTVVEQVLDGKTSGAVLRTLDSSGSFDMFRTENTFAVTLEEQDETKGALIDRVDITIDFVDNNKTGSTGNDTNLGVAFGTIPASSFSAGPRNLPTADFSYTMAEALTALGVNITDVLPGDRIAINLELFFTDGRSFRASDAAVTVTGGSFFSSPFAYSLRVDDGIDFDYEVTTSETLDLAEGSINENYQASISIDDDSEGSFLQTLNVYRTFRDLTIDVGGTNLSEAEALFDSFTIADMTLEEGARILELDYSIDQLLGDNVTLDDLAIGDDIQLRYEIVTADGRIVTTSKKGTEYFYSITTSACVQLNADAPFPGIYTVNMTDLYGDGWDGAFLSVSIDGGAEQIFTVETGDSATGTFTVPVGATTLLVTYTQGNWEDEHVYAILDPNGSKAAIGGPFPNSNGTPLLTREVVIKVCG